MSDPFRQLNNANRKVDQAMRAPGRQVRGVKNQARNIGRAPARNVRQIQSRARALKNAPGRRAKMLKNRAMAPMRGMQRNLGYVGLSGKQYKRRADRMSNTDFSISAMLYPLAWIMTPIAGFVADWDTAFIKYHLAHARRLGLLAFILFVPAIIVAAIIDPYIALIPSMLLILYWFYMWFLGFQAYGGSIVVVPFLTGRLAARQVVDFDTIEMAMGGAPQGPVRPHYDPNQGRR